MSTDVRAALTENLNALMKAKGIKSKELAESAGVSKSAVSHWLAGDNSPNIEILAKICQAYDVKLSEMLNEKIEATYEDKELLKKYRSLDDYGKEAIDSILNVEYKRCTARKDVTKNNLINVPFFELTTVSAGYGVYDDNNEYPTIKQVPCTPVTENASFCCYVNGKSMLPLYDDGDLVFVKAQQSIEQGDIGVFTLNGEMYIKKLGINELISLNPEYPNIAQNPDIICQGKVLGKLD